MTNYNFEQMRRNEIKTCISFIDDAYKRNLGESAHAFQSKKLTDPPWSWFNTRGIYYFTLKSSNRIIGYSIWRIVKDVSHLHSFLVVADFQKKGIGSILLKYYEEKSMQLEPNINIFTLHTYKETKYTYIFYNKNGYKKYKRNDENIVDGLDTWTKNCKKYDDWPLKGNKVLFYKSTQ